MLAVNYSENDAIHWSRLDVSITVASRPTKATDLVLSTDSTMLTYEGAW